MVTGGLRDGSPPAGSRCLVPNGVCGRSQIYTNDLQLSNAFLPESVLHLPYPSPRNTTDLRESRDPTRPGHQSRHSPPVATLQTYDTKQSTPGSNRRVQTLLTTTGCFCSTRKEFLNTYFLRLHCSPLMLLTCSQLQIYKFMRPLLFRKYKIMTC